MQGINLSDIITNGIISLILTGIGVYVGIRIAIERISGTSKRNSEKIDVLDKKIDDMCKSMDDKIDKVERDNQSMHNGISETLVRLFEKYERLMSIVSEIKGNVNVILGKIRVMFNGNKN